MLRNLIALIKTLNKEKTNRTLMRSEIVWRNVKRAGVVNVLDELDLLIEEERKKGKEIGMEIGMEIGSLKRLILKIYS
jgi:hypothetical protein